MIIGIAGKAESGKSTISLALKEELKNSLNEDFEIVSFATPLKLMVKALTDYEGLLNVDKKDVILNSGRTYRYFLQTLGTEWGINLINENLWTGLLQRKYIDKELNIIIDDVRFQNEAYWIKGHENSVICFLKRNINMIFESNHISENDLKYFMCDFVIDNNKKIESVVQGIIKKIEIYRSLNGDKF